MHREVGKESEICQIGKYLEAGQISTKPAAAAVDRAFPAAQQNENFRFKMRDNLYSVCKRSVAIDAFSIGFASDRH